MISTYASLTDYQEAVVDNMTGQNSFIVFTAAMPFLNTSLEKQLVKAISPGPVMLAGHESLLLLVEHASNTDHEVLFLLANRLDAGHLLLLPEQSVLAVHLISTGKVRSHCLSGRFPHHPNQQQRQGLGHSLHLECHGLGGGSGHGGAL